MSAADAPPPPESKFLVNICCFADRAIKSSAPSTLERSAAREARNGQERKHQSLEQACLMQIFVRGLRGGPYTVDLPSHALVEVREGGGVLDYHHSLQPIHSTFYFS